jgi:hypothetical protein
LRFLRNSVSNEVFQSDSQNSEKQWPIENCDISNSKKTFGRSWTSFNRASQTDTLAHL